MSQTNVEATGSNAFRHSHTRCRLGRFASLAMALLTGAVGLTACAGPPTAATDATGTVIFVPPPNCPERNPNPLRLPRPVQPLRPDLSTELVPPGPTYATICRYGPLDAKGNPGPLQRTHVVANPELRALVAFFNSSKWQVISQPAAYSCPLDDGQVDIAEFVYPSGPGVTVTVELRGCSFASNGTRTVDGYAIGQRLATWIGTSSKPFRVG